MVSSESLGGISRSYTFPSLSATGAELQTTAYGRQYAAMLRTSPARVGCSL